MFFNIAFLFFVLPSSLGARTCFCSWKIGGKTGDAPDTSHGGWRATCRYVKKRCPGDCLRQVQHHLGHPESSDAGKDKVCTLHGPTSQGVGVYAGTVVSHCKGLRYQQIVAPGIICCYRKCRHLRLMYRQNNNQKAIGIPLTDPNIRPHYHCAIKHTTLCESDSRKALQASFFGSTTVNSNSGQRVCNVLKKRLPYPGVRIEVDYDIGDSSNHHYVVPGGNVCCGCVCKLKAVHNGLPVNIPVTLPQSGQTRYFSCWLQQLQCQHYCRRVIGKVLNTNQGMLISLDVGAATKACTLINQTLISSPGVVLYSEYDVGAGPVKDKLGDTCCVKVPPHLQALGLPPIVANLNC